MSYLAQAQIVDDQNIRLRVTACAASEGVPDPAFWAQQNGWAMSAADGWGDAFTDALARGVPDPGADPDVISDLMIRTAVQSIRGDAGE